MRDVIEVSAVSYLNTTPYVAGFRRKMDLQNRYHVTVDTPAECAEKLREGKADVGLVPIAALPDLKGFRVMTEWGIGCDGAVGSVIIASDKPLNEVRTLLFDYQSRTSNHLASILVREYFKADMDFKEEGKGYEKLIGGDVAGVIIGDRALKEKQYFPFTYDLGAYWKKHTDLPFVFARWVGSEQLTLEDEHLLNEIFRSGMLTKRAIAEEERESYPGLDIYHYLTSEIQFDLSGPIYQQGQDLFLDKMAMSEIIL